MEATIIQIEKVNAKDLLDRFTGIENMIKELKESIKPTTPPNDYLSRQDIATLFQVTVTTVHDWTRKGILKAYKVGNRVYFKRAEVEQSFTRIGERRNAIK